MKTTRYRFIYWRCEVCNTVMEDTTDAPAFLVPREGTAWCKKCEKDTDHVRSRKPRTAPGADK